ncbi:hypothetical protein G9A89_019943 [Geosiphon pyriformis]|nr:hypothetical protein G9A89_019943 [Geosiphon pyriformis]
MLILILKTIFESVFYERSSIVSLREMTTNNILLIKDSVHYSNKHQPTFTTPKMQTHGPNLDSLLDEPKLYIRPLPQSMTEDEVSNFFTDVKPLKVEINRQPLGGSNTTGIVRFGSLESAEIALAVHNKTPLEAYKSQLYLNIKPAHLSEPIAEPFTLHVKQLPQGCNNVRLFHLFRPYGPLYLVKVFVDQATGQLKNQGLVQFYSMAQGEKAMQGLNCSELDGKTISVTQFVPRTQKSTNSRTPVQVSNGNTSPQFPANTYNTPQSPGPEGPLVDPCNLFIKNLDANISSSDLFQQFRKFGRIISARVMRDQETGNSKMFGFVSYTTSEEADRAKTSMNNKMLGSKQIVVRLHEPKKMREAKVPNNFGGTISPSESRAPSRRNSDQLPINAVNEYDPSVLEGLAPKARKEILMSELQKRFRQIPSVPNDEVNPIIEQLVNMKVADVCYMLKDASVLQQKIYEARQKLRTADDPVQPSIANVSAPSFVPQNYPPQNHPPLTEREKFFKVIQKVAPHNSEEILEMIMTLSKKERSLCYFNPEVLNRKIQEAAAALECTSADDDISPTPIPQKPSTSEAVTPAPIPTPLTPPAEPYTITRIPTEPTQSNGAHDSDYDIIERFLDSIKQKPDLEKKQKLGNLLFPKVKATLKSLGMKGAQATKLTIVLLDTNELRPLAHSMNDVEEFKKKVPYRSLIRAPRPPSYAGENAHGYTSFAVLSTIL